jgi:hypothetical protein
VADEKVGLVVGSPEAISQMAQQLLGTGAPLSKRRTKASVNYRPAESEQQRCGNCSYFDPPRSCQIVAGSIDREWVCDLWEQRRVQARVMGLVSE